jgi:hypothetical protein
MTPPLPQVVIPDVIVMIAPLIVAVLSGWIGQAHFPAWANAAIAGAVILVISVLAVFVGGASFTNNLVEDFLLVAAYITAVMYGPLRPLHTFLILGPESQLPAARTTVHQTRVKKTIPPKT